ncbi:MAG: ribonuclease E/G [Lachnospiraceae bacterium]|nr:ribonuclease E/G [Lachnospiraceae bacterium]
MSSENGKLLLTPYKNKILLLHIKNNRLVFAQAFSAKNESILGNIYIGKVTNVVKNIDAAFVEIYPGQICFLPLKECRHAILTNRTYDKRILAGDEIVVQVVKEAVKTKQPSVTANISFTGTYCVVTTGKRTIGYSNKLKVAEKEKLEKFSKDFFSNSTFGYVFRTNCRELHGNYEPLTEELHVLTKKANDFLTTAVHRTCYSLLEESSAPYISAVNSIYQNEYDEIITDNQSLYEKLTACAELSSAKIRFYEDDSFPLQKLYSVETKLSEALAKQVWLKSGGYLVIEPTEALTVIDVNTGKSIGKCTPEEHYFRTNMEAAKEIARQLKLRNISGIIIVDFINMDSKDKEDELLLQLKTDLKGDSVKTKVVDITPLGLVEITRQKISKTLAEQMMEIS